MSAQFFGRCGKVLYGAFSTVGMAYQSQNVNNGIPDDRVARSTSHVAQMFDVSSPKNARTCTRVYLWSSKVVQSIRHVTEENALSPRHAKGSSVRTTNIIQSSRRFTIPKRLNV